MAFQNIRSNLLRAILTLLIIAFGIMALVGILAAIDAVTFSFNDNFSGLGANSFSIERKWNAVRGNRHGRRSKAGEAISYRQAMDFKERYTFPSTVAVSFSGTDLATVKYDVKETNPNVGFVGVDENYFQVKGMNIAFGRNFSLSEVEDGQAKIVIGQEVVKKLFEGNGEKAIDKIVTVSNQKYRVIGVLASKGSSMNSFADRAVYAPLIDVKTRYGTEETDYSIVVAVQNATDLDAAQGEAIGVFRQVRGMRPGEEEDFEMFSSNSLGEILTENTTNLRLAAVVIGLMTLLGAAIGLMNIMLVSVTERTREIGIYKALGATRRSILMQFLIEAIVICQMGGILGILAGIAVGNGVSLLMGGNFFIPWGWIGLGFGLGMLVGIVSGYYPAVKASNLDPIEALRYE